MFREEQQFDQKWLWIILIIGTFGPSIILYWQFVAEKTYGNNLKQLAIPLVLIVPGLLVMALIRITRLETEIDQQEIRFRFKPFFRKAISWQDVETASVIKYGFQGGWGVRAVYRFGTIYNVKGDVGLFLTLKTGTKLLIGTQKRAELEKFISAEIFSEQTKSGL